jgi:hypothetical protein
MMVVVARVGGASGARAAAAALACAGSDDRRSALLVELDAVRPPRPAPIATAAARALEERLAAHMPGAEVASRGKICQLTLPRDRGDDDALVERIATALPLARDSLAVVHLPPPLLQEMLGDPRTRPAGALLRADLRADRALTALVVADLLGRGIEVVVLKRAVAWLTGRAALLGILPGGGSALPPRAARLLP